MTAKLMIILLVLIGLISNATSDDIVKRLTKRYYDTKAKCSHRGKPKPAYECSGIMLRVVSNSLRLAWDMKSLNRERDSFSISYLRRDQTFSRCAYNYDSGFILYPHLRTPKNKYTYEVYCAFPFDAATDYRRGIHGCYKYKERPSSGHCDDLKIESFSAWKSRHKQYDHASLKGNQCAFDMTKKSAAKYFDISMEAHRYMQKKSKRYEISHNEIKIHAWNEKKPKNIPIEAFFYLIGSVNGKKLAERNQDQFYSRGGGKVPIVGIQLPTKKLRFKVTYYRRKPRKVKY